MKKIVTIILSVVCILSCMAALRSLGQIKTQLQRNKEEVEYALSQHEEVLSGVVKTDSEDETEKETKDERTNDTETKEILEATEDETSNQETEEVSPERPILTLRAKEVEIKEGDEFDPLFYVEEITDDKTERYYLFQHIIVNGEYSTSQKGEYTLTYYAFDEDENISLPKELKLIVK